MPGRFDLTPGQAQLYGVIQRAVRDRESTAEIWGAVRREAERLGVALPQGMFQAVNTMRSLAAGLRVTSERLAKAEAITPLTAEFIGQQVYMRGGDNPLSGSSYHVRFQVPRTVGDETTMETYTMQFDGALPSTVGELYDELSFYVDQLAGDYGVALGDVGSIEIGAY